MAYDKLLLETDDTLLQEIGDNILLDQVVYRLLKVLMAEGWVHKVLTAEGNVHVVKTAMGRVHKVLTTEGG